MMENSSPVSSRDGVCTVCSGDTTSFRFPHNHYFHSPRSVLLPSSCLILQAIELRVGSIVYPLPYIQTDPLAQAGNVGIMQRLWSRTPSAQSSCRCVSCLTSGAAGLTSRGTTAASKRRFQFANSITAFYSSIFAAAALADAQGKDKRRVEWEEKIAAVREEVSVLVTEEERLLSALESRRRRRDASGRILQTRSYSTAVPPFGGDAYGVHGKAGPGVRSGEQDNDQFFDGIPKADLDSAIKETEDDEMFLDPKRPPPRWLSGPLMQQKAVRVLALKQLAIRFLLRPSIAHNYSGIQMNYIADSQVPPINPSFLLDELNKLRKRIRFIKENERENIDDLIHGLRIRHYYDVRREKMKLDQEVEQDTNLYLTGRMSVQELLLRLANNLTQSTDPDRPLAFKYMLAAFTQTRQNDLGEMLLRTLLPNTFLLTSPLIIMILNFFRKTKDLRNFDLFLKMLRGEDFPVNMGKMPVFKQRLVNGIDLTVPPLDSSNPVLYSALIAAALRFDQPHRADAFCEAARGTGFVDSYHTLFSYLRFYAIRKDWWSGVHSLKRAVAYLGSTSQHIEKFTERLIVYMVNICDACEQHDVALALIKAAIDSGFDSRAAEKQLDIETLDGLLLERWRKIAAESDAGSQDKPLKDKCFSFAHVAGELLSNLREGPNPAQLRRKSMGEFSQTLLSNALDGRRSEDKPPNLNAVVSEAASEGATELLNDDVGSVGQLNQADKGSSAAEIDNQNKEITVLRLEFGQLKEMFTQSIQAYRSQAEIINSQNEAITVLQTEVREAKKVAKIVKEAYEVQRVNSQRQDIWIQSLESNTAHLKKQVGSDRQELEQKLGSLSDARESDRHEFNQRLKHAKKNGHPDETKIPHPKYPNSKPAITFVKS